MAGVAEQRQRGGFVGEQAGAALEHRAVDVDALGPVAHALRQSRGQRHRARRVGTMEQVQPDIGAGPVELGRDLLGPELHEPDLGSVSAIRVTIWSATITDSRSSAVRSAAIVAYSDRTTSMPASDPAVASSVTAPFDRSINW